MPVITKVDPAFMEFVGRRRKQRVLTRRRETERIRLEKIAKKKRGEELKKRQPQIKQSQEKFKKQFFSSVGARTQGRVAQTLIGQLVRDPNINLAERNRLMQISRKISTSGGNVSVSDLDKVLKIAGEVRTFSMSELKGLQEEEIQRGFQHSFERKLRVAQVKGKRERAVGLMGEKRAAEIAAIETARDGVARTRFKGLATIKEDEPMEEWRAEERIFMGVPPPRTPLISETVIETKGGDFVGREVFEVGLGKPQPISEIQSFTPQGKGQEWSRWLSEKKYQLRGDTSAFGGIKSLAVGAGLRGVQLGVTTKSLLTAETSKKTIKEIGKGQISFGKRIITGKGYPEIGTQLRSDPGIVFGGAVVDVATFKGVSKIASPILDIGTTTFSKIKTRLSPKYTPIKEGKVTFKEPFKIDDIEATEVKLQRPGMGKIELPITEQIKVVDEPIIAVTAAQDLFKRWRTRVKIDKPKPQPTSPELERALFFDPMGRTRVSRLGFKPAKEGGVIDYLAGDIRFMKPRSQAVVIPTTVAKYPKGLKGVETKLKTGKPLTKAELKKLEEWQLTPTKKVKAPGFPKTREPEVVLAPKEVIIKKKTLAKTLVEGKPVEFIGAKIKGYEPSVTKKPKGIFGGIYKKGKKPKKLKGEVDFSRIESSRPYVSLSKVGLSGIGSRIRIGKRFRVSPAKYKISPTKRPPKISRQPIRGVTAGSGSGIITTQQIGKGYGFRPQRTQRSGAGYTGRIGTGYGYTDYGYDGGTRSDIILTGGGGDVGGIGTTGKIPGLKTGKKLKVKLPKFPTPSVKGFETLPVGKLTKKAKKKVFSGIEVRPLLLPKRKMRGLI